MVETHLGFDELLDQGSDPALVPAQSVPRPRHWLEYRTGKAVTTCEVRYRSCHCGIVQPLQAGMELQFINRYLIIPRHPDTPGSTSQGTSAPCAGKPSLPTL